MIMQLVIDTVKPAPKDDWERLERISDRVTSLANQLLGKRIDVTVANDNDWQFVIIERSEGVKGIAVF